MEAEAASETFCCFCTSDVGHFPKEKLLWRSVGICVLFRFKNHNHTLWLYAVLCPVCPVGQLCLFLNKYWKRWERIATKDALQCLYYKIQPPLSRLFLFTCHGPGIGSASNRNRVPRIYRGEGVRPMRWVNNFTTFVYLLSGNLGFPACWNPSVLIRPVCIALF